MNIELIFKWNICHCTRSESRQHCWFLYL